MPKMPWEEKVKMLTVSPELATLEEITMMAAELAEIHRNYWAEQERERERDRASDIGRFWTIPPSTSR